VSFTWTSISTPQTASVNTGYIIGSGSIVTVYLPTTSPVGKSVRFVGTGSGLYQVAQTSSQQIYFGTVTSSIGPTGTVVSQNVGDALELVCVETNNTWHVVSSVGTFTVN
jgi:hypothetical protein